MRAHLREPYEEAPWAFTEDHFGTTFLEGFLFVHSCTNKGPLVEGFLWKVHTEGLFVGAQ